MIWVIPLGDSFGSYDSVMMVLRSYKWGVALYLTSIGDCFIIIYPAIGSLTEGLERVTTGSMER